MVTSTTWLLAGPEGLAHLQDPPVVGVAGKLCGRGTSTQLVSTRSQPPLGRGTPERRLPWARRASNRRDGLAGVGALLALGAFQGVQLLQTTMGRTIWLSSKAS